MPRSPKAEATQRLVVAHRSYQAAVTAAKRLEAQYRRAMVDAADAGVQKVEIARLVGTSDTRVHQIIRAERLEQAS